MDNNNLAFITPQFLRSVWDLEYRNFKGSDQEQELLAVLERWSRRTDLYETAAEPAFIDEFFRKIWGYVQAGQAGSEQIFTLHPKFGIKGAGAKGGVGKSDAALGAFRKDPQLYVPQVLCEFKDIRSNLDTPQNRKGNTKSPVEQGLNYLSAARRGMFGHEPILPLWAIITDMNEFRLYWYERGEQQYLQFIIHRKDLFDGPCLLDDTEEARFSRFLFTRIFHKSTLITEGVSGRPRLYQLIQQQQFHQKALENAFYKDYKEYRQYLYEILLQHNNVGTDRFPGTRGRLVHLAQKIIDRCIFIFFCEDMGQVIEFPPQVLRTFLITKSDDPYFNREGLTIWEQLRELFRALDEGSMFGDDKFNCFNSGLFARDPDMECLHIPNYAFCEAGQGQSEFTLSGHRKTLLYLSATYNYASEGLNQFERIDEKLSTEFKGYDAKRNLSLYTLGRIFEQSITELEILTAEADNLPSLNKLTKRKRDGVYYTPEWVVERIVRETLGRRLSNLKDDCGWPDLHSDELPNIESINKYEQQLTNIRVVDPACGSGAFLISTLRFLVDEWRALQRLRRQLTDDYLHPESLEIDVIRSILSRNIYGVDINPASVEITKLTLWLFTARGDKPLSTLDEHIRTGNSLIGPDFFENLAPYSDEEKERVNAFDWKTSFPEVFKNGGFDSVVGNPPYVKLQNFRDFHGDMAEYLARPVDQRGCYESTQTGNFDLYLPFIEKGIQLLNDEGQLGYIAPSLWVMNEYGAGLRNYIARGENLWGWIDFGSYQVFDEATNYTALQFYSRASNEEVIVDVANDGILPEESWDQGRDVFSYEELVFENRWLLITREDRRIINHLLRNSIRLGDDDVASIFVGVQTSADSIYHLERLGSCRYLCKPKGPDAPDPYEVNIEDDLMKPLVSGKNAKRYVEPFKKNYILFPYMINDEGEAYLIPQTRMVDDYPKAWAYLISWEKELRGRESGKMNIDKKWYGYNYPKNLNKQDIVKLIVPRLVDSLGCSVDRLGELFLDNVDVGGITPAPGVPLFFLAGVINGKVADFMFQRISKPFRGNYKSANRQFIAPLPVPKANKNQQEFVAEIAERLQQYHTQRRNLLSEIERRASTLDKQIKPVKWLFPILTTKRKLLEEAPRNLDTDQRKDWAQQRFNENLNNKYQTLGELLRPGVIMEVKYDRKELQFLLGDSVALDKIYVEDTEGSLIAAQWQVIAQTYSVTDKSDGKKFANTLRKLRAPSNPVTVNQITDLVQELFCIIRKIENDEFSLNQCLYKLYRLENLDIRRIEAA